MRKAEYVEPLPAKDVLRKLQVAQLSDSKAAPFTKFIMRYMASPDSRYFRETDAILPETFVMTCLQCLEDCQYGVNRYTRQSIPTYFAGYLAMIYEFVRLDLPTVADEVFPADFAAEIKASLEALKAAHTKSSALR